MVKPVDHGIASSVATVGRETVKGPFRTFFNSILGGAAVLGGGVLAIGLLSALAFGTAVLPFVGAASLVAAACGGIAGGVLGGTFGVGYGAVRGLTGGVGKVFDQQARFNELTASHENLAAARIHNATQEAYMAGVQDGQQHLIREIQAAQAAQQAGFAQREMQKRAAAQANPAKTV